MEEVHAIAPEAQHSYATIWRRLAAYIIDNSIISILLLPLFALYLKKSGFWDLMQVAKTAHDAGFQMGDSSMGLTILFGHFFQDIIIMAAANFVFYTLYYSIWESSKFQATPGKMSANLKVVDENGNRMTFLRALSRNLLKIVSTAVIYIGYLMALVTEKHQTLHDKITNSYVLKTSYEIPHIQGVEYAGFWRRLAAFVLDWLMLQMLLTPLSIFVLVDGKNPVNEFMKQYVNHQPLIIPPVDAVIRFILVIIASSLITFFYYASFESSRFQATPGKIAIGIRVSDMLGQRLSFWRAAGRYAGKLVSNLTFFIGYIMAGFTPKAQALHDELADTLVVKSQVPKM